VGLNLNLAWEKLKEQMEEAKLSPAEQELVKKELLHREAKMYRETYSI